MSIGGDAAFGTRGTSFLGKALKFAGFSLEMCSKPPAAEKLQARLGLRGLAPIVSRPTAKARNI